MEQECECCGTINRFEIWAIDRLGNKYSGVYEAVIKCKVCNTSKSIRFNNVLHKKDLEKRLRELTKPSEKHHNLDEIWAYKWSGRFYDFSKKVKIWRFRKKDEDTTVGFYD